MGHEKKSSIENLAPQGQCRDNRAGFQPYQGATASWKVVLCKAKPCSCHGRTVSQPDALLSEVNSTDLCKQPGASASSSALAVRVLEDLECLTSDFRDS